MKLSRLFLAALIAGLFVSPGAHALALPTSVDCPVGSSPLGSCGITRYDQPRFLGLAQEHDFMVSGVLENNTQILITYTATNVLTSPLFYLTQGSAAPGSLIGDVRNSISSWNVSTWPAMSTSYVFTPTGLLTGTLVDTILIKNTSGKAEAFAAYFLSVIAQFGCNPSVGVTAVISSIPLPPAILLFGSGLMGLAGFSKSRKARKQS
jgi:hypothetical protein